MIFDAAYPVVYKSSAHSAWLNRKVLIFRASMGKKPLYDEYATICLKKNRRLSH